MLERPEKSVQPVRRPRSFTALRLTATGRSAVGIGLCALGIVGGMTALVFSVQANGGHGAPSEWLEPPRNDRRVRPLAQEVQFGAPMKLGEFEFVLTGWKPGPAQLRTEGGDVKKPRGSWVLLHYSVVNGSVLASEQPSGYISMRTTDKKYWSCSLTGSERYADSLQELGIAMHDGPIKAGEKIWTVTLCEGEGTFEPESFNFSDYFSTTEFEVPMTPQQVKAARLP